MAKFIEVDNLIVNVENINKVEFISDDIYLDLFPTDDKGEIFVDFITFIYGKIYLNDGQVVEMRLDLYPPEEDDKDNDKWLKQNRAYIHMSMTTLSTALKDITKIDGFEYQY